MAVFKMHMVEFWHEGGTKDYNLVKITRTDNNRAVVVRRWGKIKTLGQVEVINLSTAGAHRKFDELHKSRLSHGYRITRDFTVDHTDAETLVFEINEFIPILNTLKHKTALNYVLEGALNPNINPEDAVKASPKKSKVEPAPVPVSADWGTW